MADLGMATLKLVSEADRLLNWVKQFKPEQTHLTFPLRFYGCEVKALLPRFAKQNERGEWFYQGYEVRFPALQEVTTKPMPTAGTRDNPHRVRGDNIAHLMRDGARR